MAAFRFQGLRGRAATASGGAVARAVKRGIDLVAGAVFVLIAVPVMAIVALAIRLDSPGPILYRPKRVGRSGQIFSMFKFRTMVDGAEGKLDELRHLNVATGMVKIPNDPRVTRVGRLLRQSSLDELPQLFNVVRGDMSLVGPRPHDLSELAGYDLEHDRRFAMRPGLTGLWQISARTDPDVTLRFFLGQKYVQEWSLWLDLKILAGTIPVVLGGKGGTVALPVGREVGTGGGAGNLEPQLITVNAVQPLTGMPVQEFSE